MLEDRKPVGHARDVIRHGARAARAAVAGLHAARGLLVFGGHQLHDVEHRPEELPDDAFRLGGHAQHAIVAVEVLAQVALELEVLGVDFVTEHQQRLRLRADVLDARGREPGDRRTRRADQVVDQVVDHPPHHLVHQAARAEVGVALDDAVVLAAEDRDPAQLLDRDQAGTDAVVDVVVVVGDRVGQVGELRLERGLAAVEEPRAELAELPRVGCGAVLQDALARLERQVEPGELRIALLEFVHHSQRLQVVLEPAEIAHAFVERVLARVTERGVPEVVRQADGLGERFVQAQRASDAACDLRDLERVRQPRAIEVALVVDEDLGLVDQAAERRRMDDPVAVPLVLGAVAWRRLVETPAPRFGVVLRVGREAGVRHVARPAHAAAPRCASSVAVSASAG